MSNENMKTQGQMIPWASFYDHVVNFISLGQEKEFREKSIALAQLSLGDKVLDVGCGTGSLSLLAKAKVGPEGEVYGTDASAAMIQIAREKAQRQNLEVSFHVERVENMSFPDQSFDRVLSSLMMHHLPDLLKIQALAEIYRVLKPGGSLVIIDLEPDTEGNAWKKLSDFIIQLHGGHSAMRNNVNKLLPMLERMGFGNIQTERISSQFSSMSCQK